MFFASVLSVSEATISHDLNDVAIWFEKYDLILERKQGYGVIVNGRERSKRKALISILYEMLDGEQLKNVVSSQLGLNKQSINGSSSSIRTKLLNMINLETVKIIEAVITESENDMGFKFAESSYTALAVHLALAIKRIENGEKIVIKEEILENIRMFDEYVIALKLTKTIEKHMNVIIPEDETGYVTMHLKGARYKNGLYDTLPVPGKDITLTIDSKLQQYGEALMANKRGGIVAIEPGTGEILALISMPTYDPNLMVGRERSANFTKLYLDSISRPLLDRGLQAQYPPGSPFKIISALTAQQENVITPYTTTTCFGGYKYGSGARSFMKCHCETGYPIELNTAIYRSCNSYFSNAYRKVIDKYKKPYDGMNVWNKHVESFGLGKYLNNDLAVGRILHFLSRTPYWKNMLVIITEDDPQGGVDHIDAHRSLLMLAGPYVKKNYVSHTHANFGSILNTRFPSTNLNGFPPVIMIIHILIVSAVDPLNLAKHP